MPSKVKVDDADAFFRRGKPAGPSLFDCLKDGDVWNFKPGRDFKAGTSLHNFRGRASAWAREQEPPMGVRSKKEEDGSISIQAYHLSPDQVRLRQEAAQRLRLKKAKERLEQGEE